MSQNHRLAITVITIFGLFLCGNPVIAASDNSTKGMVVLKGKPLVAGKVTLYVENGQFVGSKVKDGKFEIDKMQSGRFRVTIEGKKVHPTTWGDGVEKADMPITNGVVLAARQSTGEVKHVRSRIVSRDGFAGVRR